MTDSRKSATLQAREEQLRGFLARFDPAVGQSAAEVRAAIRRRMPTAVEQVDDNYNALAIGFCSTERTCDCIVSVAVLPRGVSLPFYHGATLPDPERLLEGGGRQNRFLRLPSAARLAEPAVEALIAAAIAQAKVPLPAAGRGHTMIKSISARQRPRRPDVS
jgi:hypothetical protein